MNIIKTDIPDLLIIEPKVFNDDRGYFFEIYNRSIFEQSGYSFDFKQDNESKSSFGVIRGLHYQLAPFAQTKLIRAVVGRIYDVAVDIRRNSPTYGKYVRVELSEDNKRQLLIPQGFAHGFSVLSEVAIINYKCDNFYNKESERGINFNDQSLGIDWGIPEDKRIISAKDKVHPTLAEAESNFYYGTK